MDPYGNSLAACVDLPGGGFTRVHDSIKSSLNDCMKVAGLSTAVEARNAFRGKMAMAVHDEYVRRFLQEDSRRGIIPDILAHNYPASRDDVAHIHSASGRTKEAIFEIKGVRVTDSNYPKTKRATDVRARKVPKEYLDKARNIDASIAPSAAGVPGPFESALKSFATGGPIPVCVGAFSETNKTFDSLVKMLATLAAKKPDGRSLSPAPRGSGEDPEIILRNQFRRLLGVQFAKANARLKIERIHLVGSTREEAASLANQQHNFRRWNPNTDCPSWFRANYDRCNYQAWYEFRQARRSFRF